MISIFGGGDDSRTGTRTLDCERWAVVVHLHDSALESRDQDYLGVGEDRGVLVMLIVLIRGPMERLKEAYIQDMPCQISKGTDHVRVECDFCFGHFVFFCFSNCFFSRMFE